MQPVHLVCVSVDGLAAEDRERLLELPRFRMLLEGGACVRRLRGVYPTQTYPLHASLITGTWPDRHGIDANTFFQPGREHPEWHWRRADLRVPTLCDAAAQAGMSVATLLWPTTGAAPVRYNLPEIEVGPGRSRFWQVLRNGSPRFLLEILLRYGWMLRGVERRRLDSFVTASAAHLIRSRRPGLLLLHLLDLDHRRHRHGVDSPEALRSLGEQDGRLGLLLEALEQAGIAERTVVAVFGDHGLIDVHHRVNPNVALRRAGLLAVAPGNGGAWSAAREGSAHVVLGDRQDAELRRRVEETLRDLAARSDTGVRRVYGLEESRRERVGEIDFILEAEPGWYFTDRTEGQLVEPAAATKKAAHGYHPENGRYHAFFLARGPGVRPGVEVPEARVVDIGPTLAALLGLELPEAEGRVLRELMQ